MNQRKIIKTTIIIGAIAQISRVMGIARELLLLKIIGVGPLSDVFITAFKVPTTLRKILAEGALANTIIPYCAMHSNNQIKSSQLITLMLIVLQSLSFLMSFFGIMYASKIMTLIAPGFSQTQIISGSSFLKLFMAFTFFISGASLFANALQAHKYFILPALMPLILNVFFITSLIITYFFEGPLTWICYGLVAGGISQFFFYGIAYYAYGFRFTSWNEETTITIKTILKNFIIYLPTVSLAELNLFIDTSFASTLCQGTVSLLYYAGRFAAIPLSVVIGSFMTVLLPSLSQYAATHNQNRLNFYIHHAIILIIWITLPISLVMIATSTNLFITLFVSEQFSIEHAEQAGQFLQIFSLGLIFSSINRMIFNTFYALKNTIIPTCIALISLGCNIIGNYYLTPLYEGQGIAVATICSSLIQMLIGLFFLKKAYQINLHYQKLLFFLLRYSMQLIILSIPFGIAYLSIYSIIKFYAPYTLMLFLINKIGYWLWVGPLCGLLGTTIWLSKVYFKIQIFFIE